MYQGLRRALSRSKLLMELRAKLRGRIAIAKYELRDIYDSYLSKSTSLRLTPYGFKMVGSKSQHHVAMQRGEFEPEETAIFMRQFERADVFIDVGANIGFYSCLAKAAGLHVIAVEPLPRNLGYLFANLQANGWENAEVFPLGLSDGPGVATLYGSSSTGASLLGGWAGASKLFKRSIAISTLDTLVGGRFKGRRLFIKIDVEGLEHAVLLGGIDTIRRNPQPTWLVEISLNQFHPSGINPDYRETFMLFWDHGYEVRTADAASRLIQPNDVEEWIEAGRSESGTFNYLIFPRADAGQV